jgi:hypothetical protein
MQPLRNSDPTSDHWIKEIDVNSWDEIEANLRELRGRAGKSELPLLFRGHTLSTWPLETTLERNKQPRMSFEEYYRLILKVRPQIEAFTHKQWIIPTYPSVKKWTEGYDGFSRRLSAGRLPGYDYMAYLRHHGFPSPLLDWTRSLYVAAFFAFRKDMADAPNRKVAIYVFEEARIRSRSNFVPLIFRLGPYVRTHQRHFLQQSEYTLCVQFDDQWRFESYEGMTSSNGQRQGACWKFNIPASQRLEVLKILDSYNLNAFSLLNSEESLVETMAFREFHIPKAG